MNDPDETREVGVEFGPLADDLETEEYPMTKAELLEMYGNREIELESGTQTVRDAIAPLGETEFRSADEVTQSLLNMVVDEAVGRKNYSDRGGEANVEDQPEESI